MASKLSTFLHLTLLLALLPFAAACGLQPLLGGVSASAEMLRPSGGGESLDIRYSIGQPARVSVFIEGGGQRYVLRQNELRSPASDSYILRFDGTVPTTDPAAPRRLLPSGTYTYVVAAQAEGSDGNAEQRGQIRIEGADVAPPAIENLVVAPAILTPNGDAIDDITQITYRLPVTATVDIDITSPDGTSFPLVSRAEEGPFEQSHIWNGRRTDNAALSSGVYTYTVRAQDDYGNIVRDEGTITLADVGQPRAEIVAAYIAPSRVMLGDTITVTVRIRNTGTVPIRTYGPANGYAYTTDQVYSSVEDSRFTAKSGGFWRIGMDWDANGGGGARRYPFRWALSSRPADQWAIPGQEDVLNPGEEVTIVGRVQILQQETKMGFYVGLIQDGVGFFQDRTARTIIEVGF